MYHIYVYVAEGLAAQHERPTKQSAIALAREEADDPSFAVIITDAEGTMIAHR